MGPLQDAVAEGAAVFNAGNHQECCNIDTTAMNSVLSAGVENTDNNLSSLIETTLQNAHNMHSDSDRAWELRRGIDSIYGRLNRMTATMSTQMRTNN